MGLRVVIFILCWLHAASKVYWIVSNKPVMYGDNIILTCKTEHVLTDRNECPIRQWYGGHKDKLLLYNKVSRDASKYEDRTNLSSKEFSLVIKNYTESDLNINYTCSCGFKSYTKRLVLSNNKFIVYWIMSNKPVIYGDNIILTCKTGHVLTDRRECPVRQWYGGHKNRLLLYNKVSRDVTKYEDRTNVSSKEFSLVVKNYTESDLNINYTCSCGFNSYTKRLGLNNNNFIVPPLRVDTHIEQSNETFSIYIHIERVYPRPQCSVVIGERTVFDKSTLTFVKRGEFYYGTYEASFNIVDDDCDKKPTLLCYTGNEYSIVNTSGEPMRKCTGSAPGSFSTSTDTYTIYVLSILFGVSWIVLVCFFTRKIILYTWRKGHKTVSNTSDQDEPLYMDCPSYRFPVRRNHTFDANVSANLSPASDDHTVYHSTDSDAESLYDLPVFDEEPRDVSCYLSPASNVHAVHYSNDTVNNAVHLLTDSDEVYDTQ